MKKWSEWWESNPPEHHDSVQFVPSSGSVVYNRGRHHVTNLVHALFPVLTQFYPFFLVLMALFPFFAQFAHNPTLRNNLLPSYRLGAVWFKPIDQSTLIRLYSSPLFRLCVQSSDARDTPWHSSCIHLFCRCVFWTTQLFTAFRAQLVRTNSMYCAICQRTSSDSYQGSVVLIPTGVTHPSLRSHTLCMITLLR